MTPLTLETERLLLRPWRDADRAPFAALNADPYSMRYFPGTLAREESDAFVDSIMQRMDTQGWGAFALERKADGAFIGLTGLGAPRFTASFTPCIELGWRILKNHEGNGYVTEAALECLRYGFDVLAQRQLYAFTVPANLPSQAVMKRIGMSYVEGGDFDHPNVADGHALKRHVLYRITREEWQAGHQMQEGAT